MFCVYLFMVGSVERSETKQGMHLTNPSTASKLWRSKAGSVSEFSISCLTKAEELSLPCYLPIAGMKNWGIRTFPKGISVK